MDEMSCYLLLNYYVVGDALVRSLLGPPACYGYDSLRVIIIENREKRSAKKHKCSAQSSSRYFKYDRYRTHLLIPKKAIVNLLN